MNRCDEFNIPIRPCAFASAHVELMASKRIIGNILTDDFYDCINKKERTEWKHYIPIYRNICLECGAIYICGGGCYLQAEELYGSASEVDKGFCIHTKTMLDWLIKKLYYENL